jgi:hypothetical protein
MSTDVHMEPNKNFGDLTPYLAYAFSLESTDGIENRFDKDYFTITMLRKSFLDSPHSTEEKKISSAWFEDVKTFSCRLYRNVSSY